MLKARRELDCWISIDTGLGSKPVVELYRDGWFDAAGDNLYYTDRQRRIGKLHSWSATAILAHAFPALFMLTWLYLLGYLLRSA